MFCVTTPTQRKNSKCNIFFDSNFRCTCVDAASLLPYDVSEEQSNHMKLKAHDKDTVPLNLTVHCCAFFFIMQQATQHNTDRLKDRVLFSQG